MYGVNKYEPLPTVRKRFLFILPDFYFSPFYISSGISYNNTKQIKRRTEMIFIVEDDIDIREMESYALRSSGFEVEPCGSDAAATTLPPGHMQKVKERSRSSYCST